MKRIDTLIHAARWEEASTLFAALNVPVTLRGVKTFGRNPPRREVYRGTAYFASVTPEVEVTAVVPEAQLERVVAALEPLAQGGEVFVSSVEERAPRAAQSGPRGVSASNATPAATPRACAPQLRVALAHT